jgi:hypothetical protein
MASPAAVAPRKPRSGQGERSTGFASVYGYGYGYGHGHGYGYGHSKKKAEEEAPTEARTEP